MNIEEIKNQINDRKIKFRAWIPNDVGIWFKEGGEHMRYDIKEIYFGWGNNKDLPIKIAFTKPRETCTGMHNGEEQSVVLMQYTGLKDKNGKEIYEGDIINDCGVKGVVVLFRGSFCYDSGKSYSSLHELDTCVMEVIGNIFENPELI